MGLKLARFLVEIESRYIWRWLQQYSRKAEVLASQQRCYCCLAPRPRHVIATLCVAAARIWKIQWSYSRKLQLFWSSSSQKDWEVWNRRREEKNDVVFFWIPPHLGYFPCHPVSWLALIFATTTLSSKFQSTIYLLRCTTYRVSK